MNRQKILIVDDERPTRDAMARALSRSYECLTAADAELARAALEANPDIVLLITDYKMPGENGLELIRSAKRTNPSLGAILITAFGEIELAVEAMRGENAADDFLTKPITDLAQLELRVAKAIKTTNLERQVADLRSQLDEKFGLASFTGSSEPMQRVYSLIRRAAPANASVLIEGPSGTGKELVARALHTLSPRANGPFIAVECAALSSQLLESELFGYVGGAFTGADPKGRAGRFEAANGGTLFLDEIGEIDLSTQVKLLRALESHVIQRVGGNDDIAIDFRLVAATNKDLAKLVAEGRFREDLYYRLNVIDIRLPALCDRPGDIALLAARFVKEFAAANGGRVTGIEPAALAALERFTWPGNVRQLRNVIERMVVLASGPRLTTEDLPAEILVAPAIPPRAVANEAAAIPQPSVSTRPPATSLAEAEKSQILSALARCGGNKSKAADLLGISRRTIHRKLNEWNSTAIN